MRRPGYLLGDTSAVRGCRRPCRVGHRGRGDDALGAAAAVPSCRRPAGVARARAPASGAPVGRLRCPGARPRVRPRGDRDRPRVRTPRRARSRDCPHAARPGRPARASPGAGGALRPARVEGRGGAAPALGPRHRARDRTVQRGSAAPLRSPRRSPSPLHARAHTMIHLRAPRTGGPVAGFRGRLISAAFARDLLPALARTEAPLPVVERDVERWNARRHARLGPAASLRSIVAVAVIPLLTLLGYRLRERRDIGLVSHLIAETPDGAPLAVVITPWALPLDATWRSAVVAGVGTDARWSVCTNGTAWRVGGAPPTSCPPFP